MKLEELRAERQAWVGRNFPTAKPTYDDFLGVLEELGELAHHELKEHQQIRGTADEHQAAAKDAIGDLTVYACGLANHFGVDPDKATADCAAKAANFRTTRSVFGQLCRQLADLEWFFATQSAPSQGPTRSVGNLFALAQRYCVIRGWDYEEIYTATWEHVRERDWTKNKEDGGNAGVAPAHAKVDTGWEF